MADEPPLSMPRRGLRDFVSKKFYGPKKRYVVNSENNDGAVSEDNCNNNLECPSQNQDNNNRNKYLDETRICTGIIGVLPQLLLEKNYNNIFGNNNNNNNDSEEGVEHPATVEADTDSLCMTGNSQIVPDTVEEDKSLVRGLGQRPCYSEVKAKNTIASQFQHKLHNLFTLLFYSLLLTAGSAAQTVRDKACFWSSLDNYHRSLWNATDLEYCEGICVNAHEDDNKWFVSDLIEVEGLLEVVCGICLVLAMIGIILFWKVCTCVYKLFRSRNNIVNVAYIVDIRLARADETESGVDSIESDDNDFQSSFEPVCSVAASTPHVCHNHHLQSKPGRSTKIERRDLSQPTPAWQQLLSGITKKGLENSLTGGEITYGLLGQSSECVSTKTSDDSSSFEETATHEVFPLPAGIQVSMEEHHQPVAIIVSGKLTKEKKTSEINTAFIAPNINSAPLAPSHLFSSDTIQEFDVAMGSLIKTFGCIVEQGVAMESLEFTATSELYALNGKDHAIMEDTQPTPFKADFGESNTTLAIFGCTSKL